MISENKAVADVTTKLDGLEPLPDYGELFTIEEFIQAVKDGCFIDYVGTAYYATEVGMSREGLDLPNALQGIINRKFTHVMWFNR